nr:chondroitin sulfate proteoglycan 4-like [Oncorhynchus nerka]
MVLRVSSPIITADMVLRVSPPIITADMVLRVSPPIITADMVLRVSPPIITADMVLRVSPPIITANMVLRVSPPIITADMVLRVWERSVTEIRPENLDAQDEDTPPEELQVIVTPPNNGHLALKSAPTRPLLNCTLQHIHLGQLVFVHSGAMSGGFNFQVNDGVNFSPRQIFSITASTLVLSLENNQPLKVFPGNL